MNTEMERNLFDEFGGDRTHRSRLCVIDTKEMSLLYLTKLKNKKNNLRTR